MKSLEESPLTWSPLTLWLATIASFPIMVESLNFTGSISACSFSHMSWSTNVWLLCVSNKAYTKISESMLGEESQTGTIMDVLPCSPSFTQHDKEDVLSSTCKSCCEGDLSARGRSSCSEVG